MRRRTSEYGFTVIEVVVSYTILLSVSMAVLGSSVTAMNSLLHSKITTGGVQVANEQLEKARDLPFDNIGTRTPQGVLGNPPGSIVSPQTVNGYKVTTRVRWLYARSRRAYKSVTVTAESTVGAVSVSCATIIYGRSYILNAGDIRVSVVDQDTERPISRAETTVEESATGRTFTDTADESGQAVFSALPIGPYYVEAESTGYLPVATGTASTVVVAPDQLSEATVKLQRPSTIRFHVVDDSMAAIGDAEVALTGPYNFTGTLRTGPDGWVEFPDLYVGAYSYTVSKPLYSTVRGTADITAGATTITVDPVRMGRAGELAIQVNDDNGVAVPSATVTVIGPSPSTTQVAGSPFVANSSGQVNVNTLASGDYRIVVQKAGYAVGNATGTVVSGQTRSVVVVLTRSQSGSLLITVTRNGLPRVNTLLRLVGQGVNSVYRTDGSGQVLVANLAPGPYRIYAPSTGSTYWDAVVTGGQRTIVEIQN